MVGVDIDNNAVELCKTSLYEIGPNFHIEKSSYAEFPMVLKKLNIDKVDGILLDLGLSSLQLDSKDRGFSFMSNSPLDMRFDLNGKTQASDIINHSSIVELADIMYYFGEERGSRLIAKNIVKRRPIRTVDELREIIRISTPPKKRNKTMARVFSII